MVCHCLKPPRREPVRQHDLRLRQRHPPHADARAEAEGGVIEGVGIAPKGAVAEIPKVRNAQSRLPELTNL